MASRTTEATGAPAKECLHHDFTDAKNYATGNVECAKCGGCWLKWTPEREVAPEMVAYLRKMASYSVTIHPIDWRAAADEARALLAKIDGGR